MNAKYRKMIAGLSVKEKKRRRKKSSECWYVYMLRCSNGALYTGITNDVRKRLLAHQKGKGARFTKMHLPVTLAYQESSASRSAALIREYAVKSLSRKKKEALLKLSQ